MSSTGHASRLASWLGSGVDAGRGRGARFSARRKRATVMRLVRGEDLESVSRELGITAARMSQWRDQFLAAGQGPERPSDDCPGRGQPAAPGQDRRTADGERAAVRENGPAGGGRPVGPAEVDAMRSAQSISTRRAYGVQRICRVGKRAREAGAVKRVREASRKAFSPSTVHRGSTARASGPVAPIRVAC